MVTSQWHLANNNSLFSPHYRKSVTQNANKEVVATKLLNPRKGGNGDGEAARCESGISAEWVFLCFLWELRTKSTPEQSQRDRPSHPVYLSYRILKVTQGNLKTLKHKPNTELPGGKIYKPGWQLQLHKTRQRKGQQCYYIKRLKERLDSTCDNIYQPYQYTAKCGKKQNKKQNTNIVFVNTRSTCNIK